VKEGLLHVSRPKGEEDKKRGIRVDVE